ADSLSYILAVEELSKVCASTGGIIAALNSLFCYPVQKYGTEEQKHRFLTPLTDGSKIGAFALTEPEAGSDAVHLETTAVPDGKNYIVNGSKIFISGGDIADFVVVMAKVVPNRKRRRGRITAFVMERTAPGFSTGTKEKKLGIRASGTAELVFEDCPVPANNILGEVGQGFDIAMDTLDCGRISIGAQALGIATGAFEAAVKYSKERKQFGQSISKFQAIQWMLADMSTRIDAARLLVYRAAHLKDQGRPIGLASAQAKLYASEVAMWATTKALQIHGGYGYMRDYPIQRFFRDAKITEIYEGTSEIQRLVIARHILEA
ncbi:MAG: acyl-CoA dehydrogenase family protein, partial [Candidatus Wallbacteria bacterium]|nr:acyl-CoA dehydrogenase family protein [Candidatus Wallbacteria bacterium]